MSLFSRLFGSRKAEKSVAPVDDEMMVVLDAEDLAEQGIAAAYQRLLPRLKEFVASPLEVTEREDPDTCSYYVTFGGREHVVYAHDLPGSEENSWGRATCIFFDLVNSQLAGSSVRFYALEGGNDLGGMFLTSEEVKLAHALIGKNHWPYIPDMNAPEFGRFFE